MRPPRLITAILLAAIGVSAGLSGCGKTSPSAVALVEVAATKPMIAFNVEESIGKEDFATYCQTQISYITSHVVIAAALKKPGITQLVSVREAKPDPIAWLQEEIRVSFPRDGEIMQISLELDKPEDARRLVDAVVAAYMNEIVSKDDLDRRKVFDQLTRLYQGMEEQITVELKELRELAKQLGQSESEFADVDREMAFIHLGVLIKGRAALIEKMSDAELALEVLKADSADDTELSLELRTVMKPHEICKAHCKARIEALGEEITSVQEQIRTLAECSVELEAKRTFLEQLHVVAGDMASRIEVRRVELNAPSRITLIQPAVVTPLD